VICSDIGAYSVAIAEYIADEYDGMTTFNIEESQEEAVHLIISFGYSHKDSINNTASNIIAFLRQNKN